MQNKNIITHLNSLKNTGTREILVNCKNVKLIFKIIIKKKRNFWQIFYSAIDNNIKGISYSKNNLIYNIYRGKGIFIKDTRMLHLHVLYQFVSDSISKRQRNE